MRLKAAGFDVETAETPASKNDNCRIDQPIRIRAIPVPGRGEKALRLPAEPILSCPFGETFGNWLGTLVAPTVLGSLKSDLVAVQTGPGFECRNRNRLPSGKLSAHAEGLAIDIASLELADGSKMPVKPNGHGQQQAALDAVRRAACGWFTTVLGPGSDASHADHLHVDTMMHGSSDRYRICQ
ncbi:extensin family protein [Microvirga antarctica]|uniref:extensin-like domain-containing protein n=1 Tax=Microvirga antarctica TaxID=2819233 RepID=UPI001B31294A|nr:extensin family protein [Microvirga antarctica]